MAISYSDNMFNKGNYEYLNPSQNRYGNLELVEAATTQVVTTDELKAQLRIDSSDEDILLATYITAATQMAENYCNRHFITAKYKLWFKELPSKFSLYYPDVKYNFNGTNKDGLYYLVEVPGGDPGNIYLYWENDNWYSDVNQNPVIINIRVKPSKALDFEDLSGNLNAPYYFQFQTGIGDAASDIPDAIKQAIKLIASDMYYFREDRKRAFPMASEILLQPYKCYL